jgi:hypothetical protein
MLPRIVSDWIEPFSEARFRKPAGWAECLRPAAPAACTMPTADPSNPPDAGMVVTMLI